MKRFLFFILLSTLFAPFVFAQQRNPTLENTLPFRRGNFVTVDRLNAEIRMSDITYDNFRQMERNIAVLQRNARDAERIIQSQDRVIRQQQQTIDNLQRRLNNLEREVNNFRRR